MSSHDVVNMQADKTSENSDIIEILFIVMIFLQINSYTEVEAA